MPRRGRRKVFLGHRHPPPRPAADYDGKRQDAFESTVPSLQSSPSQSESLGGPIDAEVSLQNPTLHVGGEDLDSDRYAKKARLTPPKHHIRVEDINSATDEGSDSGKSLHTLASASVPALGGAAEDGTFDNDEIVFEAARETIEGRTPGQEPNQITVLKEKRPKGWHLRRENRQLRQTLLQGSPIRSERQDSIDTQETNGYEPAAILRRLPGRRRAPHADPRIEADMRRQLELKIAYRAVAKAIKPVLAELASRTEDDLSSNSIRHEETVEFHVVAAKLNQKLEARLAAIEHQQRAEEERLNREHDAALDIVAYRCLTRCSDFIDEAVTKCRYRYMRILRHSQRAEDDQATDEEAEEQEADRQLFGRHAGTTAQKMSEAMCNSRCHWFLENQRLWKNLEARHDIMLQQQRSDPASLEPCPRYFAVYDGQKRAEAFASINILTLLDAHSILDQNRDANLSDPSTELVGNLQILATAASVAPRSRPLSGQQPPRQLLLQQHPSPSTVICPPLHSHTSASRSPGFASSKAMVFNPTDGVYGPPPLDSGPERPPSRVFSYAKPIEHPPPAANRPVFQVVGSIPGPPEPYGKNAVGPPRQRNRLPTRPSEDQKPSRRKAFTFDIIMHHPSDPTYDTSKISEDYSVQSHEEPRETGPTQPRREPLERKRPGPKAVYANSDEPRSSGVGAIPSSWKPFSNSMGPPVAYPPSYVQGLAYPSQASEGSDRPSHEPPKERDGTLPKPPSSHVQTLRSDPGQVYSDHQPAQQLPLARHGAPSWRHGSGSTAFDAASAGSPALQNRSDSSKSMHSHKATPAAGIQEAGGVDTWRPYQQSLAPKPRALSYSENALYVQPYPLSRSPSGGVEPHLEGPSTHAPPTYTPGLPLQRMRPQDVSMGGTSNAYNITPDDPSARAQIAYHNRPGYGSNQHTAGRNLDDDRVSRQHPFAPSSYLPHTGQRSMAPRTPPPAERLDEPLPSSMQSHPGQRIGQQILPSTLIPSKPQSSVMAPRRGSHHHKHRSSSGSARSWHITATPHSEAPASHQREGRQMPSQPLLPPPPHPSWQQSEERSWPGLDMRQVQTPFQVGTGTLRSPFSHDTPGEYIPRPSQPAGLAGGTESLGRGRDGRRAKHGGRRGRQARTRT